jgi:hypothetical protein
MPSTPPQIKNKTIRMVIDYANRDYVNKVVVIILLSILVITLILLLASVIISISTVLTKEVYSRPICFSNACATTFTDLFSLPIKMVIDAFSLIVFIITIGGFTLALETYRLSLNTSSFANNISNYQVFHAFVTYELANRERISNNSLNIFMYYNSLYNSPRTGDFTISKDHLNILDEIESIIVNGNNKSQHAYGGEFRYTEHQDNMIKTLKKFGFDIEFLPRQSFFELEEQVMSLISTISTEFCNIKPEIFSGFSKRLYI